MLDLDSHWADVWCSLGKNTSSLVLVEVSSADLLSALVVNKLT